MTAPSFNFLFFLIENVKPVLKLDNLKYQTWQPGNVFCFYARTLLYYLETLQLVTTHKKDDNIYALITISGGNHWNFTASNSDEKQPVVECSRMCVDCTIDVVGLTSTPCSVKSWRDVGSLAYRRLHTTVYIGSFS